MANQETQILDDILLKSRRKMLTLGAASLATMAIGAASPKPAAAQAASYTDADVLNFALNLEYLEANFYYMAAFGTTIGVANAASQAAGALTINLSLGKVGTAGTVTGGSKVPFATIAVGSYATETAVEEGKHVNFLLNALGSAAVAQPAINIAAGTPGAFGTLANAAGIANGSAFSPYTSDANFLIGAYVFEDVGVTAYHGAASLLTTSGNLLAAAGILAVEAYHAGLIRSTIFNLDPANTAGYITLTNQISALRAKLSAAASLGVPPQAFGNVSFDSSPDDVGLQTASVSLAGGGNVTSAKLTDADPNFSVAFARNTTQVLNIVTGGGAVNTAGTAQVSPAKGVFFPAGLNGLFK